ncbi:MAG: glycosyltransferase, partial [Planktotalea sp.]|uniref:glycosyltransferase family 2 protein n=1 Tax=Planktotalea sp. TaxID=2029877 RepID=UPI003C730355
AFDVLQSALQRVAQHTDLPWRLILIEDCSTDARVRPMLRVWCDEQRHLGHEVDLIENETNLGFIGSVNKAFARALEHRDHVVLLNSDALVPKDWAQRLVLPILKNPRVATVTPLSNDAEIFSAPLICQSSQLEAGVADQIDARLSNQISAFAYKEAPTGVGFCMAINTSFLRKTPRFDPVFGKGYGEEVDWCQKATSLGGLHMCQPNLFVEHRGGASFGSAAKRAAIARNNKIVSKRHPAFDQSVQRFIAEDPLRSARLYAAITCLAATQNSVSIYIAHSLGGGAELYLQEKLAEHSDRNCAAIVLRVGGLLRWRVEVHTPQGMIYGDTDDTALLHRLLCPIKMRSLIYSCAVGDPDPLDLIETVLTLKQVETARLTFLVHDYFAVSPSYCLLDSNNKFQGLPTQETRDQRHDFLGQTRGKISNKVWRENWRKLLEVSEQIVCFSNDSATLMADAFPRLNTQISVAPHAIAPVGAVCPIGPNGNQSLGVLGVLGVLGDIGIQKGAKVLSKMSEHIMKSDFQSVVIVGRADPQFPLGQDFVETGAYKRSEIAALAERHNISAWLIPSIWPETFSYTTHEALATGLPVFAFDLGAQGDAVACAQNGHVIPLRYCDEPRKLLLHIQEVLAHGTNGKRSNSGPKRSRNRGFAA